jgi:hypothetical protein
MARDDCKPKLNRSGRTTAGLAVVIGACVAVALALVAAIEVFFAGSVSLIH